MQNIKTLPDIKGFHWLCSYCESHVILGPKTTNRKPTMASSTTRVQNNNSRVSENTQNQTINLDKNQTVANNQGQMEEVVDYVTQTNAQADTNGDQKPICIHYRNNRCKHGISGKNCDYRHPKPCKTFMTYGDKANNGCSNGRKCEFLHPRICRTSLNKHECFNENCKYMHIKGTKRQRPKNENITPTIPKGTGNLTYAEACRPQPIETINQHMQQPQISTVPQIPTGQSFLEILQQIQTRLKTIEAAQQGQASQLQAIMIPRTAQAETTPQAVQYQHAPAIWPGQGYKA
jgi:hypothetical protein